MNPRVSLIIRTFNEEKYLGPLLDSIKCQSYKNYEIIVVDSESFDRTIEIATSYCDKILKIKQEEFTFGFSLNFGINSSEGELICILSAHTLPLNDDWLVSLVQNFYQNDHNGRIAMVYGKQVGSKDVSNYGEIRDYERNYKDTLKIQESPDYFCNNANSMIRRELWEKHPFDESLSGLEDIEWAKHWMSQGYCVVYEPKASVYHIHNEFPEKIKIRFWREAVAGRSIGVVGVWDILKTVLVEAFRFINETLFLLSKNDKRRINEVLLYRYNKVAGRLKSLWTKKVELLEYSKNYASLEYEVLEVTRPGVAKTSYRKLGPTRPNEALVRVIYVGICETDMEVHNGNLEYYKSGWAKYPIVPCHEFSGVVVRKGVKVKNLNVGDRVVCQCILSCGVCKQCLSGNETACNDRKEVGVLNYDGAYAKFINIPSRFVNKIPDNISLKTGSSIEPVAVVLKGLKRVGIKKADVSKKENIMVVGAGPIGHIAARLCNYYGHAVSVVEKNIKRKNLFDDIRTPTFESLTCLDEYTIFIETTSQYEVAQKLIKDSKAGSKILFLGLSYGKIPLKLEDVVAHDKSIIGSVGSGNIEFIEAIEIVPYLNLRHMDEDAYEFHEWKKAWDEHKEKTKLKIKVMINQNMETNI